MQQTLIESKQSRNINISPWRWVGSDWTSRATTLPAKLISRFRKQSKMWNQRNGTDPPRGRGNTSNWPASPRGEATLAADILRSFLVGSAGEAIACKIRRHPSGVERHVQHPQIPPELGSSNSRTPIMSSRHQPLSPTPRQKLPRLQTDAHRRVLTVKNLISNLFPNRYPAAEHVSPSRCQIPNPKQAFRVRPPRKKHRNLQILSNIWVLQKQSNFISTFSESPICLSTPEVRQNYIKIHLHNSAKLAFDVGHPSKHSSHVLQWPKKQIENVSRKYCSRVGGNSSLTFHSFWKQVLVDFPRSNQYAFRINEMTIFADFETMTRKTISSLRVFTSTLSSHDQMHKFLCEWHKTTLCLHPQNLPERLHRKYWHKPVPRRAPGSGRVLRWL